MLTAPFPTPSQPLHVSPHAHKRTVGVLAALVILLDYLLVMTFLCANCILYHNYFEMKPGLCCACFEDCCSTWKCAKGGCEMLCNFDGLMTTTEVARGNQVSHDLPITCLYVPIASLTTRTIYFDPLRKLTKGCHLACLLCAGHS